MKILFQINVYRKLDLLNILSGIVSLNSIFVIFTRVPLPFLRTSL